jgi:hypothetical protein
MHRARPLTATGVVLLLGVFVLVVPTAEATLMVLLGLDEMARDSELVVRGTVTESTTRSLQDGRQLVTFTTLRVLESFKGSLSPEATVTFGQLGGHLGSLSLEYEGRPVFKPGEEVIVFLERTLEDTLTVHGMAQGRFLVTANNDGLPLVRRTVGPTQAHSPLSAQELSANPLYKGTLSLDEFREVVAGLTGETAKPSAPEGGGE